MTKHAQSEVDAAAADLLLHLQASVSLADRPIFKKGRARTSSFRGVTKHRFSSKYEAHLWDNSWVHESGKKGKQVYLGGYDTEEKAATTYDLAALKYWGPSPTLYLNFPGRDYSKELEQMKTMTRTDYITHLKRNSSGFSRGASKYRGVTRHHCEGRWQARIGRDKGSNDIYLGTFASEKEAAEAYDIAAIKLKGVNAVTNFHVSSYDVEEIEKSTLPFERPKQNKRKEAAELATMEFTAPAPAFEFRMQQQEVGDQVMMQIQAQPETNGYLQAILVQEDKVPAQAESHAQADVYPYSYPQVMTQIQAQPESNGYLQTSLGQEDQVPTQSESHAQANGYPYNYPQVMMQVQAQLQTNGYRQPLLGMKSQAPTQAQAQTQAHRYPYFYPQVIMQFQKEPQTDYYPQAVLEQEFQAPTQARAQEQAQDQRYPPATLTVGYPWQYPVFFYPVVNYSPYRP